MNLRNGLPLIDRISLIDTFLFWAASHTMRLVAFIVPALYLLFGIQAVRADVSDAVSYVAPFIVAQLGVLGWLTNGRILPIISDLYGTLCATEVVKAVVAGLFRPKGQKFKVTAKGGDRSKRAIQWPVLRIFLFYLILNVLGIVHTFVVSRGAVLTDTSMMALFWSWYNIIILVLACCVCIEQPQRRYRHRFRISDIVVMKTARGSFKFPIRDISVNGVRLVGAKPVAVRENVILAIGDFAFKARVVRTTEDGFALAFEPSLKTRANVIRYIFSKRYLMTGVTIRPGKVVLAIGARLLK